MKAIESKTVLDERFMDVLLSNRLLFVLGAAGTGKTTFTNKCKKALEENKIKSLSCAPTGAAAQLNHGQTIHSLFGIRPCAQGDYLGSMKPEKINQLKNVDVIFIDEVSMVHKDLVGLISKRLREVSGNDIPFGGKKIIFSGDMLQLPPISNSSIDGEIEIFYSKEIIWKNVDYIYLEKIHRQTDRSFIEFLNQVRLGYLDQEYLKNSNLLKDKSNETTVKLYYQKIDVKNENDFRLGQLKGDLHSFTARRKTGNTFALDKLQREISAPEVLQIKEGAKIVFVRNEGCGSYYNGNVGIVKKIRKDEIEIFNYTTQKNVTVGRIVFSNNDKFNYATLEQFPIALGYAMTIHKAQGTTLKDVLVNFKGANQLDGLAYTALSRATSENSLSIINLNSQHVSAKRPSIAFDKIVQSYSRDSGLLIG